MRDYQTIILKIKDHLKKGLYIEAYLLLEKLHSEHLIDLAKNNG